MGARAPVRTEVLRPWPAAEDEARQGRGCRGRRGDPVKTAAVGLMLRAKRAINIMTERGRGQTRGGGFGGKRGRGGEGRRIWSVFVLLHMCVEQIAERAGQPRAEDGSQSSQDSTWLRSG